MFGPTYDTGSDDFDSDTEGFFNTVDAAGVTPFAAQAHNRQIQRKIDLIEEQRKALQKESYDKATGSADQNQEDWGNLKTDIFGADGNKLTDFYGDLEGIDAGNVNDYLSKLSDYKSASDMFNDPNFMANGAQVKNQAVPSAMSRGAQEDALNQFKTLSQPGETAQDRLAREMSRREMEQNMRGDREAMASRLKSRGMYGSGAELSSQLSSQAENASRRSLENMQAQAAAQQRQQAALASYAGVANQMRGNETKEGSLANQVAEFNSGLTQQGNMARGAAQLGARNKDNDAGAARATSGFNAQAGLTAGKRADNEKTVATTAGFTKDSTAQRGTDTNTTLGAIQGAITAGNEDAARLEANKENEGFLHLW